MPPVGFEPTISAGERPQTYALDRAATGTGAVSIEENVVRSPEPGVDVSEERKKFVVKVEQLLCRPGKDLRVSGS